MPVASPPEEEKVPTPVPAPADGVAGTRNAHRAQWIALSAGGLLVVAILVAGGLYYRQLSRELDRRTLDGIFADTSDIYGASVMIRTGDSYSFDDLKDVLELAGYGVSGDSSHADAVSTKSERKGGSGVSFSFNAKHEISRILVNGRDEKFWDPGLPLIANVSARRDRRQLVSYDEIPQVLVHAVIAVEDKHFFEHDGVDLERVVKAGYVDLRRHKKEQGASTLTMQLVRGLWLDPDKTWKRKVEEAMMTVHLERKWSKEEIFTQYANQVFLGRQAAYNIHGFAEGARAFFGKELNEVSLPEAALLAGMVQRPSYFNPVRNPEHATERRNLVLALMQESKFISPEARAEASATPLRIRTHTDEDQSFGAPYYLDLIGAELEAAGQKGGAKSVYTTIDPRLERAASEAIEAGMREVDAQLAKTYAKTRHRAEAALIALDPHTGEIKALIGGRDYAKSQLNRVSANRPPGSVFKPFVYAAAINTGIAGSDPVFTEATLIDDAAASFAWDGQSYQPKNFRHETYGAQTLRDALAHSDNVATVKVATAVGLDRVVAMARQAGLNRNIRATPSVALGAYAVTPLEMSGAYTVFANGGVWVRPHLISEIRSGDGEVLHRAGIDSHQAIDPRVAAEMVNMLQEVMRSGTAAGVRARGFLLPAAGKTGTSHDGWFAGFTTQLLCVVWVGFDDYSDLGLEGAKSALPIWTAFMKKAANYTPYREAGAFPDTGLLQEATICTESGKLAGDRCTKIRSAYFIPGTTPQEKCTAHDPPDATPLSTLPNNPEPSPNSPEPGEPQPPGPAPDIPQ